MSIPIALTIAGSDSGGGAGIQADLKTFAYHHVHGACAITCVTAQNTLGVTRVDAMLPESVSAQIEAVAIDLKIGALKTGMLLNSDLIRLVAKKIAALGYGNVVIDPVMVSRAGVTLIDREAIISLTKLILPLALIVTPNLYEAQILAEMEIKDLEDMQIAAKRIYQLGARSVLVKGGALLAELKGTDLWFDGEQAQVLQTEIIDTPHTHGTGCTLSAAIASQLALGQPLDTAVKLAKDYITKALKLPLAIGKGQGTITHFLP
jgi:hydroxymethylpyrimidine/phosphomethylpyrimidine kinase